MLLIVDTGNDSVLSVETNLSATPFDFDNQTRALSLRKTLDSEYGDQTFRIIFKCKLQGLPDSASVSNMHSALVYSIVIELTLTQVVASRSVCLHLLQTMVMTGRGVQ